MRCSPRAAVVVLVATATATAGAARGDGLGVEASADGPPADAADDHAAVQAAFGAGSDAGAVAMADLRAEWTGSGLAIALGARVRWRDGELVRADWAGAAAWLGVLRRLELAHHGTTAAGAVGVGQLAPATVGAVVAGYTLAALVDHRAPGAIARIRGARAGAELMVDDLTAPTLVAAAAELAVAARWRGTLAGAADPAADRTRAPGSGAVELGARYAAGPVAAAASVVVARGGDAAVVGRLAVAGRRGRFAGAALLEARGYRGAAAAAPYGPTWPVERERMAASDAAGVATAIGGKLVVDGVGVLTAELRTRGARGDLWTARLALPWWRAVQLGAYAAIAPEAAIAAGEARVVWGRCGAAGCADRAHWFSSLEAGRGYRRGDAGELAPVWQLSAWFGAAAGW